jgi:hypothetical protein
MTAPGTMGTSASGATNPNMAPGTTAAGSSTMGTRSSDSATGSNAPGSTNTAATTRGTERLPRADRN